MSAGRLFTYGTWAAFLVTGSLFVAGQLRGGDGESRHIAAGTGLSIEPGATGPGTGRAYKPPPSRNVPIHVDVYEFGFAPSNTIAKVGQAIAFRGVGKQIHNIVPTTRAGEEAFFDAQEHGSARPIFTEPGLYPFACVIHPKMKGTITVVSHF